MSTQDQEEAEEVSSSFFQITVRSAPINYVGPRELPPKYVQVGPPPPKVRRGKGRKNAKTTGDES